MKFNLTKKKKIFFSSIAIVIVLMIAVGIIIKFRPQKGEKVTTVTCTKSSVTEVIELAGTISSDNKGVFTLADGIQVADVKVKPGDKVIKGQLLATFDTSSLSGQLSEKTASYNKALETYNDSIATANKASSSLKTITAQISETERQIAELEKKAKETETTTKAKSTETTSKSNPLKGIDFSGLKNIFGSNYSSEQIKEMFEKMMSYGGSSNQIQNIINALTTMGNSKDLSGFDFSAITSSSGNLLTLQTQLITLKAQKTILETQSKNLLSGAYKTLVDTAKDNLDSYKEMYNTLSEGWKATGSGIVTELNIESGEVFSAKKGGSSLDVSSIISALSNGVDISSILEGLGVASAGNAMTIEYYDQFVTSVVLSETDILKVNKGQHVKITTLGNTYNGEVISVSPTATSSNSFSLSSLTGSLTGSTAGVEAKILIKDPDDKVIIGLQAEVEIIVNQVDDAVVIPVEAMQYDSDGNQYVYIVDKKSRTVKKSKIKIGIAENTQYEVLDGCNEGDLLVRNPSATLIDGAKVTITGEK